MKYYDKNNRYISFLSILNNIFKIDLENENDEINHSECEWNLINIYLEIIQLNNQNNLFFKNNVED